MSRLTVATLCLLLAGCAVGPDFQRPAPPVAQGYRPGNALPAGVAVGAEVPAEWWRLFRSPALDALVARAFAANPDLAAARASLRAAQESAAAQGGALWPQVGIGLQASRQKNADVLSSPLSAPVNPYSLHTAQVTVGYTLDVFGGNRRAVESLEAQAEAQAYELEAARLSLAANVVAAAVQEASLRGQIAAAERMVALQAETLELTRRQQALGAVAQAAVVVQEAALAQTQAGLPPLKKQLALTRDMLSALIGESPDQALAETFTLEQLELPAALPLSLPSRLVAQRPDVRAAEAQAHAAAAQVGVAFAAMLPQFSITAGVGSVATRFGDFLKAGTGFWGIAGSLAQPLFAGGSLGHRKAAAEAGYDQALAQYRATALAAFQNVADTLHALEEDGEASRAADAAYDAAHRSYALAERQVALGDISHLALLNAELAYRQAAAAQVQARAARYADAAALLQALGGGWWNRPEGMARP